MDETRASRQLRLIGETASLAAAHGVEVWLRGGWAMDLFLGAVTRDHADVDWFAWSDAAPVLRDVLPAHGYAPVAGPPPDLQLDLVKDGLDVSVTFLDRDAAGRPLVAGGRWRGEPFPEAGAVHPRPGRIGEVECAVLGPHEQIVIKEMTPVWMPERPRRAKDAADVDRLRRALRGDDGRGSG